MPAARARVASTALSLLVLFAAVQARAASSGQRWWGVLVGVGQYPRLDVSLQLDGPPNDVPLILDWLSKQQVPRAHLTVLADGVSNADALPTRSAILGALSALARRTRAGDHAFLYFGGHGSQQPQGGPDWTKADGLDETFLPRDVGRWDGAAGRVAGAITGREIGQAVHALRAQGVFVWLVFDSCHSATAARAVATSGIKARAVPPQLLGAPAAAASTMTAASDGHVVQLTPEALPGGFVAFYAAQTRETAPEMPLPAGVPSSKVHGLFTYALLRSLAASPSGSYRDLAHRILAHYLTTYPDSTPDFEGMLDESRAAQFPRQPDDWPAVREGALFHIAAGRLSDVTPGSLLTISAAFAADGHRAPMALLSVRRTNLTEAWADPVADPRQLLRWHIRKDRSAELGAGVAHLVETNWDERKVRISGPQFCLGPGLAFSCGPAAAEKATTDLGTARSLLQRASRPAGTELTAESTLADVSLIVAGGRLFVVNPRALPLYPDQSPSVDLRAATPDAPFQQLLTRAVRAVALQKLAGDFPGRPDGLRVEAWTLDSNGRRRPLAPGEPLSPGAEVIVRLQNTGPQGLDVTILSIDDQFGIDTIFPRDRETNRLPGTSALMDIHGWETLPGRHVLLVIGEEARPGQPHDLSFLAQPGTSRASEGSDFDALLAQFGFSPPQTRAVMTPEEHRAAVVEVVRYAVTDGRAIPGAGLH